MADNCAYGFAVQGGGRSDGGKGRRVFKYRKKKNNHPLWGVWVRWDFLGGGCVFSDFCGGGGGPKTVIFEASWETGGSLH